MSQKDEATPIIVRLLDYLCSPILPTESFEKVFRTSLEHAPAVPLYPTNDHRYWVRSDIYQLRFGLVIQYSMYNVLHLFCCFVLRNLSSRIRRGKKDIMLTSSPQGKNANYLHTPIRLFFTKKSLRTGSNHSSFYGRFIGTGQDWRIEGNKIIFFLVTSLTDSQLFVIPAPSYSKQEGLKVFGGIWNSCEVIESDDDYYMMIIILKNKHKY